MKKITIKDMHEIAEKMIQNAEDSVQSCGVFFYEDAIDLIKALMEDDRVHLNHMEIAPEYIGGYFREYLVFLEADDFELSVERAWHGKNKYRNEGYYVFDTDRLYIYSNASSQLLQVCDNDPEVHEVEINEDEDCDPDAAEAVEIYEGADSQQDEAFNKLIHRLAEYFGIDLNRDDDEEENRDDVFGEHLLFHLGVIGLYDPHRKARRVRKYLT